MSMAQNQGGGPAWELSLSLFSPGEGSGEGLGKMTHSLTIVPWRKVREGPGRGAGADFALAFDLAFAVPFAFGAGTEDIAVASSQCPHNKNPRTIHGYGWQNNLVGWDLYKSRRMRFVRINLVG